jgi:multidrug resistance protein MdtO
MWLFFDHLWAKSSTVSLRSLLLATLRDVARLECAACGSSTAVNQQLIADSTRINRNLDNLRSLSDLYAFESFPKTKEETFLDRFLTELLPQVRAFLLVKTGLLQHRLVGESVPDDSLVIEVLRRSTEILLRVTHSVERLSPAVRDTRLVTQELRNRVKEGVSRTLEEGERRAITEMRLCSSLLELALHVEAGVQANLEATWGFTRGANLRAIIATYERPLE